LNRPFPSRNSSSDSFVRVNGKIRAREVRVIGVDNKQLGVMPLNDALSLARQHAVDLVEIAATAVPPVCRLVNLGKFRYEKAKKEKESKKHQHASTVKEIQLSPRIDPHDLGIKIAHAVDFLCDDMKVKVSLKFRGREMQHTEIGFDVIKNFLEKISPFGHRDFEPKLIGKGINVMVTPLPRNKRAKHPTRVEGHSHSSHSPGNGAQPDDKKKVPVSSEASAKGLTHNPFANIEVK